MFGKIKHTDFPPTEKPQLVWDGECGFCKYWVTYWHYNTENRIDYRPYQQVATNYMDFPLKEFKKASRLIETDGKIYSGPDSAFRSFTYFKPANNFWHKLYSENSAFAWIVDHSYTFIAKHRPLMFKLTHLFFGKNPERLKPYWLIYILLIIVLIVLIVVFL